MQLLLHSFCAQDWIRTSTPVKALPPQSSVSTNFTTWAYLSVQINVHRQFIQIYSIMSHKNFFIALYGNYLFNSILNIVPFPASLCFT